MNNKSLILDHIKNTLDSKSVDEISLKSILAIADILNISEDEIIESFEGRMSTNEFQLDCNKNLRHVIKLIEHHSDRKVLASYDPAAIGNKFKFVPFSLNTFDEGIIGKCLKNLTPRQSQELFRLYRKDIEGEI